MSVIQQGMEVEQPRDTNGRFAETAHERARVPLSDIYSGGMPIAFEMSDDPASMSDEDYNAGGTFDYPPVPRSAAQVKAFWASVHIPDVALTQYDQLYRLDVERSVQAHLQAWDRTHKVEDMPGKNSLERERALPEARAAAEAEFRKTRNARVWRGYLRTAVRVMRMLEDAKELTDPAQRQQIEQLPIQYDPEKRATTALGIDSWAGIRDPQLRRRACATTAEMERTGLDDLRQEMRERMVWLSEQIAEVQGTAQAGVNTQIAMAEWEDRRAGRIK